MFVLISILVHPGYTYILAYSYVVLHLWYTCICCGQLICLWNGNPSLVRNVGHVLVLSVEHTYKTYEINVGRSIRFGKWK
jgi:hypothetical protein